MWGSLIDVHHPCSQNGIVESIFCYCTTDLAGGNLVCHDLKVWHCSSNFAPMFSLGL